MTTERLPVLLTIDDDISVRDSIACYFEDAGYDVVRASGGEEGLAIFHSRPIDVVVTDLRMPGVNGLGVIKEVSRHKDSIPVIMLSGTDDLADAIESMRQGAWDYLTKPVQDMAELELIIQRCMERARLLSENRTYQNRLEMLVNQRTAELHKLKVAVEQSANSVVITDTNGIIEYANPKFSQVTGYQPYELIGASTKLLNSGTQPAEYYQEMWKDIQSGKEWRGEFCNRRKNGDLFWEICSIAPIRNESGTITNFIAIKEDITERKAYEEQLHYQAHFDTLTGLPNRFHLQSYLEMLLEACNQDNSAATLLLVDIDNLKFINDTFGHDFGDRLLVEITQRLRHVCGDHYLIARFVGDEFVIVPRATAENGNPQEHAEMIRTAIGGLFAIDGTEVLTTASIGVVTYPQDGESATTLLKNAEAAMYQAKKNGKNSIQYYTREFSNSIMERFELEAMLHYALERNEFSLVYQPQVNLADATISGVEALLRWTPSSRVPVSPAVFIPLLEETGLIVAVGEWVLWEACSQARRWQNSGLPPLRMSINLSALQIIRSDLGTTVSTVLQTVGLDPAQLRLELTESMVMVDNDITNSALNALTATGAQLSLDDFGTGYSSLGYLSRMPISELKIDRSFVSRMLAAESDAALVNAIIAMGRGLGMELVAEGVETEDQLLYLCKQQCKTIQGYFFSPPLSAEGIESFIREWDPRRIPESCRCIA